MNITYTKNYDELIEKKRKEIRELEIEKEKETEQYYIDNKISCNTCRYNWLNDLSVDYHTLCEKGECKLCKDVCDEWEEENETSKFLEKYEYEEELARAFEDMFNTSIADADLEKVKMFVNMYYS